MNDNNSFNENEKQFEDDLPLNEVSSPESNSKFKDYGMKGIAPFADLFHRYKDDIGPYMSALSKGLNSAGQSLNENDAERTVGNWFREIGQWFDQVRGGIESKDEKELLRYLEEEAEKRPMVMFSTSYVAGLFFGRMGKHMIRTRNAPSSSTGQIQ